MKTNSVQNIENIKDIRFSVENDPVLRESKLTIVASTDNDIFTFVFKGDDLIPTCKKAGLFSGWEKDYRILALKHQLQQAKDEITELKQENEQSDDKILKYIEMNNKLQEENENLKEEYEDLQHKYNLEQAANEAQRKFFREYAGKGTDIEFNYAIGGDEVTYVVIDKEEYKALKNISKNSIPTKMLDRIAELDKLNKELADSVLKSEGLNDLLRKRVKALEELKTPTIENFEVEEHSDQPKTDNVNHPSHYETGKFECIEVMQEVFGTAAVMSFCKCNAFKYTYRMDRKNGKEDAQKAIWYLNKYLELGENKDGGTDDGGKKQVP